MQEGQESSRMNLPVSHRSSPGSSISRVPENAPGNPSGSNPVAGSGVMGVPNGTSSAGTGVVNNFDILKNAGVHGVVQQNSVPRPPTVVALSLPGPGYTISPFNAQPPASFHHPGMSSPALVQHGVQRQPHIPRAPTLVCVPNQQAQYPQQPRVIRHLTTTSSPTPLPVPPGPSQPNGQLPPRRPIQYVPTSRQPHPVAPSQRTMQARPRMPATKTPLPPPNARMMPRPPTPASATPQPPAPGQPKSTFHHYRIGPGNGTMFPRGMPLWIPPTVQGPSADVVIKDRDPMVTITVNDRKVRLTSETEPSTLYSICRRWLRNDVPRKDHVALWDTGFSLPRPDTQDEEAANGRESNGTVDELEDELPNPVAEMSPEELLLFHVKRAKRVKKRLTDDHQEKLKRCKARLDILLQP